jgi:hypothetical protein
MTRKFSWHKLTTSFHLPEVPLAFSLPSSFLNPMSNAGKEPSMSASDLLKNSTLYRE